MKKLKLFLVLTILGFIFYPNAILADEINNSYCDCKKVKSIDTFYTENNKHELIMAISVKCITFEGEISPVINDTTSYIYVLDSRTIEKSTKLFDLPKELWNLGQYSILDLVKDKLEMPTHNPTSKISFFYPKGYVKEFTYDQNKLKEGLIKEDKVTSLILAIVMFSFILGIFLFLLLFIKKISEKTLGIIMSIVVIIAFIICMCQIIVPFKYFIEPVTWFNIINIILITFFTMILRKVYLKRKKKK